MKTINDISQLLKLWPYHLPNTDSFLRTLPSVAKTKSIKVGFIDTGVNKSHPCFAKAKLIAKDFSGGSNAVDELGHGTHCAALLVGHDIGVHVGLIPDAKLYAAKVVGRYRKGPKHTEKAMVEALKWLIKKEVHIILITMGRTKHSVIIENQIQLALNQGIIVIASAGNHGGSLPLFPSSIPQVVCVSAMDRNGLALPECYTGSLVDVFTPGEAIISADKYSKYCEMSGSSQAAAIFCGLIARKIAHI
ncbi:S8 family serine peptidase [Tamlana sp. 2_MG-2023]|uniref:S8 family peptidase n=1 Tax=unclassified Tamlana TaxID=2614803 RepID=UPI0026E2594A|nr:MULTISPECIES: S8 family serine peptidase [unclassified Tamlana]MDO6761467.1 S8 family serine peptidase [Tamlana sp. 2_MG-2023]MDO6792358.1 S8 family serine peptidase [Tamlana sp. 1_MG-2023]